MSRLSLMARQGKMMDGWMDEMSRMDDGSKRGDGNEERWKAGFERGGVSERQCGQVVFCGGGTKWNNGME